MKRVGVSFEGINKIIITHQDIDHVGGIRNIQNELNDVEIMAHEADKPYNTVREETGES